MDSITRKPDFQVEIVRPNYDSTVYAPVTVVKFVSSVTPVGDPAYSTDLLSYSFKESLDIESDFSLSLTLAKDENRLTWLDKIRVMDLVFISEFGKVQFAGCVKDKRYSARIAGETINRSISISGISLASLVSEFNLIIDQFLFAGEKLAPQANLQLVQKLTELMGAGAQVAPILAAIYNSFFELALKMGNVNQAGMGIKAILDNYIDFNTELSSDVVLRYPIALSIYHQGENNIWSILKSLVVAPIDELFVLWNPDTKKYEAVFRQAPFEPSDWEALSLNKIPALLVADHDLGASVSEVYTYYLALLAGSGMGQRKAMLLGQEGSGYSAAKDEEKWRKYGYKPLIVEFKHFDKDKAETYTSVSNTMTGLGKMMKRWFEHNDEFLNGSIQIMTIDESCYPGEVKNPRIGERLEFLDGQFYIEEVDHSWSYGDSMRTRLSVSRGYRYSGGTMVGAIENPGRRLDALSRDFSQFGSASHA